MTSQARPLRWGLAGAGKMARAFADDFAHSDSAKAGATIAAVASRRASSAELLAGDLPGARGLGSYAELMASDVDVIYVSTPHPQHRDLALAAIAAGKPVLVEKAFTATLAGAQEVVSAAQAAGVFCMEAMWTRLAPGLVKALELVDRGAIGELTAAQVDFGAFREYDESDRLFDRATGGGTVLDLGVYAISVAQFFLGAPDAVSSWGRFYPNGADAQMMATLIYPDRRAQVFAALQSGTAGRITVVGTEGSLEITPRFHRAKEVVLRRNGQDAQIFTAPEQPGAGYWREVDHVADCLAAGLTESPLVPLHHTVAVQRTMQAILDELGVETTDEDLTL